MTAAHTYKKHSGSLDFQAIFAKDSTRLPKKRRRVFPTMKRSASVEYICDVKKMLEDPTLEDTFKENRMVSVRAFAAL